MRSTVNGPNGKPPQLQTFLALVLWHMASAARTEEHSEKTKKEVMTMHNRNRWRTPTQTKEDEGTANEGRTPIMYIPKVIYAPELPDPYRSTQPYVPCPMRYHDDYD
jgi:hypothetical protein